MVSRSTRSVVDPKNNFRKPLRPCVLITINSHDRSRATRRISPVVLPTTTWYSRVTRFRVADPSVSPGELLDLTRAVVRVPGHTCAQIQCFSQQRIRDREHMRRAPRAAATAAAYLRALAEASEKSIGQRMERVFIWPPLCTSPVQPACLRATSSRHQESLGRLAYFRSWNGGNIARPWKFSTSVHVGITSTTPNGSPQLRNSHTPPEPRGPRSDRAREQRSPPTLGRRRQARPLRR